MMESALNLPLPIASAIQGQWRSRRKLQRTPRRLATLKMPSNSATTNNSTTGNVDGRTADASGTIVCLAGDEYIVVANTVANGIFIYRISQEQHPDDLVSPWCVVPLSTTTSSSDIKDTTTTTTTDENEEEEEDMVDPKSEAVIVSLTALPFGQSLVYGETCRIEEGHIVAMTDDGQGFVVRLRKDVSASLVFQFSTMNFGVTCASVVTAAAAILPSTTMPKKVISTKNNQHTDLQLLVGYQSGYLENWKIFRFSSDKILAKMTWRGIYPNNYTIQKMTPLNVTPPDASATNPNVTETTNNTAEGRNESYNANSATGDMKVETPSKKPKAKEISPKDKAIPPRTASRSEVALQPRYLLLTLFSPTDTLKTGAMMEVIDVGDLARIWKNNDSKNDGMGGRLRAINLNQRWIMPAAGMELLNSATISNSPASEGLPRCVHILPSTATGSICTLPQGNGTALPDGTIALVSTTEEDGDLRWGIANDYNQLLLPYPAIGCASINWGISRQQPYIPHVACCLRGGSTYLIPFAPPNTTSNGDNNKASEDTMPVTVFTFDTETHARYVSAFMAGNLILSSSSSSSSSPSSSEDSGSSKHDNRQSQHTTSTGASHDNTNTNTNTSAQTSPTTTPTTTPVLIYGWAGGIIDVYSCELMELAQATCRPMISHREVSALEELLSNGSLGLLIQVLSTMDDTDPLLSQQEYHQQEQSSSSLLWKESRRECRQESLEGVTANDLLLPKFTAIRSLLLMLATTDNSQ